MSKKYRYELIRDDIITNLVNLKLKEGDLFSSDAELCQRYNAGRNTVRHAVKQLEQAGFLVSCPHVGILAGPRCRFENNGGKKKRIMMILPEWSFAYGNKFETELAAHLESGNGLSQAYQVEFLNSQKASASVIEPDMADAFVIVDSTFENVDIMKKVIEDKTVPLFAFDDSLFDVERCVCLEENSFASLIKYFLSFGHRNIGMLCHFGGHRQNWAWMKKFILAMNEYDLPIIPGGLIDGNTFKSYNYESLDRITAWICVNRRNIHTMLDACRIKGLRIPDDISVIGTDEHEDQELGIGNAHIDFNTVASVIDRNMIDFVPGRYKYDMVVEPRRSVAAPPQKKAVSSLKTDRTS